MCKTSTREDRSKAISAASKVTWQQADQLEALIGELSKVYLPTNMQKQVIKDEANHALSALRSLSRTLAGTVGAI